MSERETMIRALHEALGGNGWAYTNYGGDELVSQRDRLEAGVDAILALSTEPMAQQEGGECRAPMGVAERLRDRLNSHPGPYNLTQAQIYANMVLVETAPSPAPAQQEGGEEWVRNTAMNVMLATEVEEACRILIDALQTRSKQP